MRSLKILVVLIASMFTTLPQAGCLSQDERIPQEQATYFDAQESWLALTDFALAAKRTGKISQESWDSYWGPGLLEGDAILDEMNSYQANGELDMVAILRNSLVRLLTRLQQQRATEGW